MTYFVVGWALILGVPLIGAALIDKHRQSKPTEE